MIGSSDAESKPIRTILPFSLSTNPLDPTTIMDGLTTTSTAAEAFQPCQPEMDCALFTFIVYVIIQGTMFTLGFIGNTLSFAVLQSDRKSHAATFLLQAMAVIDNLFLISAGFVQTFPALTLYFGISNHWMSVYIQVFIWPWVHVTQIATIFVTVLIALNRYIAICHPYAAERLCSLKVVKIQVIVMSLFVLLYNLPRFLEHSLSCRIEKISLNDGNEDDFQPEPSDITTGNHSMDVKRYGNSVTSAAAAATQSSLETTFTNSSAYCSRYECETALKTNNNYKIIYENVLYCLVVFLGPFILLIVFNVLLVIELCRSHRKRAMNSIGGGQSLSMEAEDRQERNNITRVMLVIIVVFLVTQTPAYINQILYYLQADEEYQCGRPYFYYFHISNLFVTSNSCVNFVVYCACRQQFRQRLTELKCCGRWFRSSRDYDVVVVEYCPSVTQTTLHDHVDGTRRRQLKCCGRRYSGNDHNTSCCRCIPTRSRESVSTNSRSSGATTSNVSATYVNLASSEHKSETCAV